MKKGRSQKNSINRKPKIRAVDRKQMHLHPVDTERLIEGDHAARQIWHLLGRLDLGSFYAAIESEEGEAGRSAFDPRMLISLWVYAYSRGIGSAREVSRRCEYDPAFMWLTGLQSVNAHTLSDFRVGHEEALDELFTEVLGLLSSEGLITLERVSHDGTKIRANASEKTFNREERIHQHLEVAREQVKSMGDPTQEPEHRAKAEARQEAAVREREQRLEKAVEELENLKKKKRRKSKPSKPKVSTSDPQARIMKHGDGGYLPSYNVQLSVDNHSGLIAAVSVTNEESDTEQLLPAMDRLERLYGRAPDEVLADGAYTHYQSVSAMAEREIDYYSTWRQPQASSSQQWRGISEEFHPSRFHYDAEEDVFTCPEGKRLRHSSTRTRTNGTKALIYRAEVAECRLCAHHERCCPRSLPVYKGRAVTRRVEPESVMSFKRKMQTEEAKEIYRQRSQYAEFPNLWVKIKIGLQQFSLRGLAKVTMEAKWAALTFDIQRYLKLCPPDLPAAT